MVSHLVVDVGGVIAPPLSDKAAKKIEKKGIRLDVAMKIRARYDDYLNKGESKFSDFLKEYNKETGQDWNVHEFQEVIFDNIDFNEEFISFCKNLEEARPSVFSDNFRANVEFLNKKISLDDWTYKQVYSYNYGVTKKDEKFYEILFDKLGAEPEECLLIDDMKRNVEKSRKIGMDAIHFTDNDQLFKALEEKKLI